MKMMTTIPKKKLEEKQRKNIESLVGKVILAQKDSLQLMQLLREILTPTEYEALLRRVVAMLMLDTGESYYAIHKSLGISVYTLRNIDAKMKKGNISQTIDTLREVVSYIPNNKDRTKAGFEEKGKKEKGIVETLGDIAGILPYYGESFQSYQYRKSQK